MVMVNRALRKLQICYTDFNPKVITSPQFKTCVPSSGTPNGVPYVNDPICNVCKSDGAAVVSRNPLNSC